MIDAVEKAVCFHRFSDLLSLVKKLARWERKIDYRKVCIVHCKSSPRSVDPQAKALLMAYRARTWVELQPRVEHGVSVTGPHD